MSDFNKSFSFLTVAYNHEKYIVEHLESIKYLICEYGNLINCNLIINDDFSKDKTVELIDSWLEINSNIFTSVVKIYNKENLGTCKSILNMLESMDCDAVKLTAGDDVYSCENIFEYAFLPNNISMRTGIPLNLVDGVLFENKKDIFNILTANVIYKEKPLISRFKLLSNNNAPNIIYNKLCLEDNYVRSFLEGFDVVEDWPLQVSISERFPDKKFDLINKVFVYYRRTTGSAYIVANSRFSNDKSKLYNYLIEKESNFLYRFVLLNRFYWFGKKTKAAHVIFNSAFYLYFFSIMSHAKNIFKAKRELDLNFEKHKIHYKLILERSNSFFNKIL